MCTLPFLLIEMQRPLLYVFFFVCSLLAQSMTSSSYGLTKRFFPHCRNHTLEKASHFTPEPNANYSNLCTAVKQNVRVGLYYFNISFDIVIRAFQLHCFNAFMLRWFFTGITFRHIYSMEGDEKTLFIVYFEIIAFSQLNLTFQLIVRL